MKLSGCKAEIYDALNFMEKLQSQPEPWDFISNIRIVGGQWRHKITIYGNGLSVYI